LTICQQITGLPWLNEDIKQSGQDKFYTQKVKYECMSSRSWLTNLSANHQGTMQTALSHLLSMATWTTFYKINYKSYTKWSNSITWSVQKVRAVRLYKFYFTNFRIYQCGPLQNTPH